MEAIGQSTGGIAHDFNNLLAIVSGNLELLLELPTLAPDARELAVEAIGASDLGRHSDAGVADRELHILAARDVPDTDGIELMRFLAREHYRSRLLIISGSGPQLLRSALSLGRAFGLNVAGTIAKPLRIHALRALLGVVGRAA